MVTSAVPLPLIPSQRLSLSASVFSVNCRAFEVVQRLELLLCRKRIEDFGDWVQRLHYWEVILRDYLRLVLCLLGLRLPTPVLSLRDRPRLLFEESVQVLFVSRSITVAPATLFVVVVFCGHPFEDLHPGCSFLIDIDILELWSGDSKVDDWVHGAQLIVSDVQLFLVHAQLLLVLLDAHVDAVHEQLAVDHLRLLAVFLLRGALPLRSGLHYGLDGWEVRVIVHDWQVVFFVQQVILLI